MENAIKGWQYISAIFQRMIDLIEKENLIEPQLIYRGITRRYFSSSNSITELLNKEPDFIINNIHNRTEKMIVIRPTKFYITSFISVIRMK